LNVLRNALIFLLVAEAFMHGDFIASPSDVKTILDVSLQFSLIIEGEVYIFS
jgi:hypothetical protein